MLDRYEDTVDERLQNMKSEFATQKKLDEAAANCSTITNARIEAFRQEIASEYNYYSMTWFWLFVILAGAFLGFLAVLRYAPQKASFLVKAEAFRRHAAEISTPGEYKTQIEQSRQLKLAAVATKLAKEEKTRLIEKIDRGEINTAKQLEDEVKIVEGMKNGRDSVRRKPGRTKQN